MQDEIPARAASLGIGEWVTVEPAVPSTEVPSRLREFDVLALPSLTTPAWKEQFGRVLQEAMACAIPVVGSDSGEIPHVIGDAGLVVPEGDPTALCDAIGRLMLSPEMRAELGRRGRERALKLFTQASVARRTVEVYREVMERQPSV